MPTPKRHNRKAVSRALHSRHDGSVDGVCFYCGLPADTLDHVPPLSAVHSLGVEAFSSLIYVPACRECNSTLGDRWVHCLADRALYLRQEYLNKYRVLLDMPLWSDEELDNLDTNSRLKHEVLAGMHAKKSITLRLERLLERGSSYDE